MIGYLRGRLVRKQPPSLVMDVGGIGYDLEAPMSTFYKLPDVGAELTLHTHLVVREDAHLLYGFASEDERRLFRDLLKVSGVGPKIGLALLSGIDVSGFLQCIETQDVEQLVRIPGIGRKTAERLIIEMRDRVRGLGELSATINGPASIQSEAQAALVALGYKPAEAARLLKNAEGEGLSTEEWIRRALQAAVR